VLVYEEVIPSLGIARPVPVSYSFGGMLAAELAATFLDLPDKLVLLDAERAGLNGGQRDRLAPVVYANQFAQDTKGSRWR